MCQSYLSMSKTALLFVTSAVCSPEKGNKYTPPKKGFHILHDDTVMTYNKMPTDLFHCSLNDVDSLASTWVGIIYLL